MRRLVADDIVSALLIACVALAIGHTIYDAYEPHRAFNAMTPAKHLEEAKSEFRAGLYELALNHARAITSGTELSEARQIGQEALTAKGAARQAEARRLQAEQLAEQNRIAAVQLAEQNRTAALDDLQMELKNLGYDLTVSQSDKPDEVVITSNDFGDTDHRVRFLSFLRSRNSPTAGVCAFGFQKVRLKSLFWFSDLYALECINFR